MTRSSSLLLLLAALLTQLLVPCYAAAGFNWAFDDSMTSTTLTECQSINVRIISKNNDSVSFGIPPYYFMAMEIGGIPTVDLAGTNRSSLKWQVNHRAGTKLLLTMVDSTGIGGGCAPRLYDVIAGKSQSCFPPPRTNNDFQLTANVTTRLKTCQPWGVRVKGGTKPYNVTLSAPGSPVITNATLGPTDDVFTYINRADPDSQLLISVVDANGQFANGTAIVNTYGSTKVDCTGLVSSSGNSTIIDKQMADAAAASKRKQRNTAIAASVSAVAGLAILGALTYFFIKRRRQQQVDEDEMVPRIFIGSTQMSTIHSPNDPNFSGISSAKSGYSYTSFQYGRVPTTEDGLLTMHSENCPTNCDCRPIPFTDDGFPQSPPGNSDPMSRRARKAMEARLPTQGSSSSGGAGPSSIDVQSSAGSSSRIRDTLPDSDNVDIIIQHRDAGDEPVVQELPPPYANRNAPKPKPSKSPQSDS